MPTIVDTETEAAEFENILKDVGKSIAQSCTHVGQSGLNFEQFKPNFLKQKKTETTKILRSNFPQWTKAIYDGVRKNPLCNQQTA